MKCFRCIVIIQFVTAVALGQSAQQRKATSSPERPDALVQSLYQEVVARAPVGIPSGADLKILTPYLSMALQHRIALARACGNDWLSLHKNLSVKPPFAWLEAGLFSGQDERTGPKAFAIERTESENDGSSHVYVTLKWWETSDNNADRWHVTPNRPVIWRVAAIVVRENKHFALDDVIYLKDKDHNNELRLSELLTKGCDGSHWVGYTNR
jgi:hypothetical protein